MKEPTPFLEALARRVLERRTALRLSQRDLAARIGVSNASVAFWEQAKSTPSAAVVVRLCRVLKCPPAWLLGMEEVKA